MEEVKRQRYRCSCTPVTVKEKDWQKVESCEDASEDNSVQLVRK